MRMGQGDANKNRLSVLNGRANPAAIDIALKIGNRYVALMGKNVVGLFSLVDCSELLSVSRR